MKNRLKIFSVLIALGLSIISTTTSGQMQPQAVTPPSNDMAAFAAMKQNFQESMRKMDSIYCMPVSPTGPYKWEQTEANIGVDLQMKWGLYANASFNHRDGMPITSDNEYNTPAYNLLNAKLGIHRTVCKHFNVNAFAGANNITGTQYYYMVFLNQLPDAYLPAPDKITCYGGVELTYEIR